MFSWCKSQRTELDIIENTQPCEAHGEPIMFVCLNTGKCIDKSLLCMQCLDEHRGHDIESVNKYFTPQVKESLETGTSRNGKKVKKMSDNVLSAIQKLRVKVIDQISVLETDISLEMRNLRNKYPIKSKFGIQGQILSNKNVEQVINIVERQKNDKWIDPTETFFLRLLKQTENMISNLLISLDQYIENKTWEDLDEESSYQLIQSYLQQYRAVFVADQHYFKFSQNQKHTGIKLSQDLLEATFAKQNPSKPAVLTQKAMNQQHPRIYFEITKSQKTAIVFESALIALGVCLPKKIKGFSYRNAIQASHGGYLIGSNGKCYHTKLPQYQKKDIAFSFGEGEIVAVWLNYQERCVYFSKPGKLWGKNQFKMQLDLEDELILKLKPCVMFHGEPGAKVRIFGEEPPPKKK